MGTETHQSHSYLWRLKIEPPNRSLKFSRQIIRLFFGYAVTGKEPYVFECGKGLGPGSGDLDGLSEDVCGCGLGGANHMGVDPEGDGRVRMAEPGRDDVNGHAGQSGTTDFSVCKVRIDFGHKLHTLFVQPGGVNWFIYRVGRRFFVRLRAHSKRQSINSDPVIHMPQRVERIVMVALITKR